MYWNLKDYGDPIEKKAFDFINNKGLNGYKDFWNKFVGNVDGKPAQLEIEDDVVNIKRKLIAQWNYSVLKNLYTIELLLKHKYRNHKINKKNIIEVISYDRDVLLVTHLTYNNISILDKINKQIKGIEEKYNEEYKDFINFRNLITHNIKPLTKVGYQYEVPKNFEWFTQNGKDTDNLIWSDESFFKGIAYQPIVDYFHYCINVIISSFKCILKDEMTYCEHLFNTPQKNRIINVPDGHKSYKPASGTTEKNN